MQKTLERLVHRLLILVASKWTVADSLYDTNTMLYHLGASHRHYTMPCTAGHSLVSAHFSGLGIFHPLFSCLGLCGWLRRRRRRLKALGSSQGCIDGLTRWRTRQHDGVLIFHWRVLGGRL